MAFDIERYERRWARKKCIDEPGRRMCKALERCSRDKYLFPDEVMAMSRRFARLAGSGNPASTAKYWIDSWCFAFGMIRGECPITAICKADRGTLSRIIEHHMGSRRRNRESATFEILDFLTNQGRYKWKQTN